MKARDWTKPFFAASFLILLIVFQCQLLLPNRIDQTRFGKAGSELQFGKVARQELPRCYARLGGSHAKLAQAIIAVEYGVQPRLTRAVEQGTAWFSEMFSLPPIDLSYGAAQVRPSTIKRYANLDVTAAELMDDCRNIELGRLVVMQMAKKYSYCDEKDRRNLIVLLKEYNGQRQETPENLLYTVVVLNNYAQLFPHALHAATCDGEGL